jgi:hypothetical protein
MHDDSNQRSDDRINATTMEEAPGSDGITESISSNDALHIDSAHAANWLVRKVLERRRYRERVQVWADGEIRRAEREE